MIVAPITGASFIRTTFMETRTMKKGCPRKQGGTSQGPVASPGHFHTRTLHKGLANFEQTYWPCLLILMLGQIFHSIRGSSWSDSKVPFLFHYWFLHSHHLCTLQSSHNTCHIHLDIYLLIFPLWEDASPSEALLEFVLLLCILIPHRFPPFPPISPRSLKAKLNVIDFLCPTRKGTCFDSNRHSR